MFQKQKLKMNSGDNMDDGLMAGFACILCVDDSKRRTKTLLIVIIIVITL